jgi:hypothetical protein
MASSRTPRRDDTSPTEVSEAHREQTARLAREMAERLMSMAVRIEATRDPRKEIAAVHRARMGLRGVTFKAETYKRLMVMEALHRATTYADRARSSRAKRSRSGTPSLGLAAEIARALFEGVCPEASMDDPNVWMMLLEEWSTGRGAPSKTDSRRRDRTTTKWDRLARLFREHVPGCTLLAGRTLASEWGQWKRGDDHWGR